MATPYLGEIRVFSFGFPPKGWALCNGQTLAINQNQALFALLGTTYGGNGTTTFQLPNLQARMPIHVGNGFTQGQVGGEATHTLISSEMPSHNHSAIGVTTTASSPAATNATWAASAKNPYSTAHNTTMAPGVLGNTGGSQSHDNMPPYLTLNFCIALNGIFPSRN
jgi:microcystin-dependent protein